MIKILGFLAALSFAGMTSAQEAVLDQAVDTGFDNSLVQEAAFRGGGGAGHGHGGGGGGMHGGGMHGGGGGRVGGGHPGGGRIGGGNPGGGRFGGGRPHPGPGTGIGGGRHGGGNFHPVDPPPAPKPGIGHGGPGRHGGGFKPVPGFDRHKYRGWIGRGHRSYAPIWWGAILAGGYLSWRWYNSTPNGFWQCLAYNENGNSYPGYGVDANQAADSAIDLCQRSSGYSDDSCFIPEDYCRVR